MAILLTTQTSTSVQQTMEIVALTPTALTLWAASRVPVSLDTPEMDLPAQVKDHWDNFIQNLFTTTFVDCVDLLLRLQIRIFNA